MLIGREHAHYLQTVQNFKMKVKIELNRGQKVEI